MAWAGGGDDLQFLVVRDDGFNWEFGQRYIALIGYGAFFSVVNRNKGVSFFLRLALIKLYFCDLRIIEMSSF